MNGSILALLFLLLLAIGLPIYLVLGGLSVFLYWLKGIPLISLVQLYGDRLNSITVVSIPLFVITAAFLEKGAIARALIDWAEIWVGRVSGGLAVVCIIATTIFAAMSGSSTATAMAMGMVMVPAMLNQGYSGSFASGTIAAAGTLGILIPPSLVFILYAIIAEQSIPRLFLAGIIPGLIQALAFVGYGLWHANRKGYRASGKLNSLEIKRRTVRAMPALLIPLIVLGGIYSGLLTVSEAAGIAAALAMTLSVFVYRECRYSDIIPTMASALMVTAALFFIMIGALSFSHWLIASGVSDQIVAFFSGSNLSGWQFLLLMNVLLLVLGTFLEVFGILFIAVPVLLPIAVALGIDPIHFGVILVINMELAFITPPVGLNLFVMQSISSIKLSSIYKGVFPYVMIMLALLAFVSYVPSLSLWLPGVFYN